jgi:hypothetical protein
MLKMLVCPSSKQIKYIFKLPVESLFELGLHNILGLQEQVNLLEEEHLPTMLDQNVRLAQVIQWMRKIWLLVLFRFLISTFWRINNGIWSPCSAMFSVRISPIIAPNTWCMLWRNYICMFVISKLVVIMCFIVSTY